MRQPAVANKMGTRQGDRVMKTVSYASNHGQALSYQLPTQRGEAMRWGGERLGDDDPNDRAFILVTAFVFLCDIKTLFALYFHNPSNPYVPLPSVDN
jgi:hypothetical protein